MKLQLILQMAELLRCAAAAADPGSEFRAKAEDTLQAFEAKAFTPSEPIFLLRGRDQLAADAVRHWAAKASVAGVRGPKVVEALEISSAMEIHAPRRLPD